VKIVLLHERIPPQARPDERDVLDQMAAVEGALAALGHAYERVTFSPSLPQLRARLNRSRPDLVFNLVEAVYGHDSLIHLAPALLDALGYPYTGASTEAMVLTTIKILAKEIMQRAGLPTPAWLAADGRGAEDLDIPREPWIVKCVREHASCDLDGNPLVQAKTREELLARVQGRCTDTRREHFAERFVRGREFNLSLLALKDGAQVLPAAEIRFDRFPPGKPRIVDYRAKWIAGSFEYENTPRSFSFPASDGPLLTSLTNLALSCWALFRLRGYARVDFRVDDRGCPWILEINANPCLSPDAGFAAALAAAEIPYAEGIRRILDASGISVIKDYA